MRRFVCLGVFVALCLASAGFAEEKPPSLDSDSTDTADDQKATAKPVAKKSNKTAARRNYTKATFEAGKLIPIVLDLTNQCDDAVLAKDSAAASAPIAKRHVNDAKALQDKYPKSKKIQTLYANVKEFPEHIDQLMRAAEAKTKEVCDLIKKAQGEHGKVGGELNKMTAIAPQLVDVTDDNADEIIRLATAVREKVNEASGFFNATMRVSHKKYSTALSASHMVEELQKEADDALGLIQRAVKNFDQNGEDKPEVAPATSKPVIPEKPEVAPATSKPVIPEKPQKPPALTHPSPSPKPPHPEPTSPAEVEAKAPANSPAEGEKLSFNESARDTTKKAAEEESSSETLRQPKIQPSSSPVFPKTNESDPLSTTSDTADALNLNLVFSLPFLLFIFSSL